MCNPEQQPHSHHPLLQDKTMKTGSSIQKSYEITESSILTKYTTKGYYQNSIIEPLWPYQSYICRMYIWETALVDAI